MKNFLTLVRQKSSNLGMRFRAFYYGVLFGSVGEDVKFLGWISVYSPENITIGSHTRINEGCIFNARDTIVVGAHVHISYNVTINTTGLDTHAKKEDRGHVSKPVHIENGVWIGSGAIINPGVRIGEDSIVGAGAVVTKNIPAGVVAAGVPAKIIKTI